MNRIFHVLAIALPLSTGGCLWPVIAETAGKPELPIGLMMETSTTKPDPMWLLAEGGCVSKERFKLLYSKLGDAFSYLWKCPHLTFGLPCHGRIKINDAGQNVCINQHSYEIYTGEPDKLAGKRIDPTDHLSTETAEQACQKAPATGAESTA
jgi:hypothetical protein